MALQLTYTDADTDVTYTDAYHRVFFDALNFNKKIMKLRIGVFKNLSAANTKSEIKTVFINPIEADFDTYFAISALNTVGKNPRNQAYDFLKTIDPEEVGSAYPWFPFDYKNDSSDV